MVTSTDSFSTNFGFVPLPRLFPAVWSLLVIPGGTPATVDFGVDSLGLNTIWASTDGGVTLNLLDGANFDQSGTATPLIAAGSTIYAGNFQDEDAFVAEISAGGTSLSFSSFLGGTGLNYAQSLALDSSGNAYLVGTTAAQDFPATAGAAQTTFGGFLNAFVAKIDFNSSTPITRAITQVLPNDGGNAGTDTITIDMSGAEQGATVELIGTGACAGHVIDATSVSVSSDSDSVTATFNLASACVGTYNVEVLNPDSTSAELTNGFTVQASGSPHVWVAVLGRSVIRAGQPSSVQIAYGNSGNEDAYFVPLWISFDDSLSYNLLTSLPDPPEPLGVAPIDFSTVPISLDPGGKIVLPILLPAVRAGTSGTIQLQITAPGAGTFAMQAAAYPSWFNSPSDLTNLASPGAANFDAVVSAMTSTWAGIGFSSCATVFPGDLAQELNTEVQTLPAGYNDLAFGILPYAYAAADNTTCGASWPPVSASNIA